MSANERQTIRVGYMVLLEVGIDPDSGDVVDVTVYTEEANHVQASQVYVDGEGELAAGDPKWEWAEIRASAASIGIPGAGDRDNVPPDVQGGRRRAVPLTRRRAAAGAPGPVRRPRPSADARGRLAAGVGGDPC